METPVATAIRCLMSSPLSQPRRATARPRHLTTASRFHPAVHASAAALPPSFTIIGVLRLRQNCYVVLHCAHRRSNKYDACHSFAAHVHCMRRRRCHRAAQRAASCAGRCRGARGRARPASSVKTGASLAEQARGQQQPLASTNSLNTLTQHVTCALGTLCLQ